MPCERRCARDDSSIPPQIRVLTLRSASLRTLMMGIVSRMLSVCCSVTVLSDVVISMKSLAQSKRGETRVPKSAMAVVVIVFPPVGGDRNGAFFFIWSLPLFLIMH